MILKLVSTKAVLRCSADHHIVGGNAIVNGEGFTVAVFQDDVGMWEVVRGEHKGIRFDVVKWE